MNVIDYFTIHKIKMIHQHQKVLIKLRKSLKY